MLRIARAVPVALAALLCAALFAPAALAGPHPYRANDAGGFRNVLPPGSRGLATLPQAFAFRAGGALPPHFADQQPLYEELLYAAPGLTDAGVADHFKDASFGVPPGEVAETASPRPGVTIQRDAAFGVPHIYGDTRADTMFGAGWAAAADRLFLIDVLRHMGRAELASFLGGSNAAADAEQWGFAPYTEADLERQIEAIAARGEAGRRTAADLAAYVEGVNAYIAAALADPSLRPAEYALLGKPIEPWRATDVIAIASLVGGIFGRGGGQELRSALALQALERRFGRRAGRRAWLGFRAKNDPEAPTTISRRFPYQTRSAFARRGLALPDPGSVRFVGTARASAAASSASRAPSSPRGVGERLREALAAAGHASNWLLVAARRSASGHPLAVMGPQVGYFVPQLLMEQDLHGPGIDARGAAFPGVNLCVQLGRGRDYAWSATSAGADNVDTFAELLCRDRFHYRYRGRCRPMEKLVRRESWAPNAIDPTPAGSQALVAHRTVHGVVYARGKVRGRPVAFVRQRSTYFHEADSVVGFAQLNEPGVVTGIAGFKRAVSNINFTFNWAYADAERIAYALSGAMPQRARGTSPDLPVLGTGEFDWQGFDPRSRDAAWLPFARHPQAVDPDHLVSWNNKPAPGWAAADDQYGYGPLQRSQMLSDKVRRATRGKGRLSPAGLVRAMEEAATQDLRGYRLLPLLLKAVGQPRSPALRRALATLRAWQRAGAHRRDLDRDGPYEHEAAVVLMDAWWPELVRAEFRPALGSRAFARLREMLAVGDHTGGSPRAPDFFDGWWGYVSKDLRALFGPRPRGSLSRAYCGRGSRRECRRALRRSLAAALRTTPAALYGGGDGACAADPRPSCFDLNRPQVVSGIQLGPFPFQNRPTFQQVVDIPARAPR